MRTECFNHGYKEHNARDMVNFQKIVSTSGKGIEMRHIAKNNKACVCEQGDLHFINRFLKE